MARQNDKRQTTQNPLASSGPKRLKISTVIVLILLIELIALGLKAYDDRNKALVSAQTITHREALAVSEFIAGKAAGVSQTIALSYQAGWGPRQTTKTHPDLDAVITLADALTANPGSRLRDAGETASQILAAQQSIGLSQSDDFVIVYKPAGGTARIGLVRTEAWMPQASGERTFTLRQSRSDGPQPAAAGALLACSPVDKMPISACVETVRPVFGRQDMISLIIYALLLAGPALVILGLLRMLDQRSGESEEFEGQATRAGRILATVLHESKAGFWSWDGKTDKIWLSEEAAALSQMPSSGHYTTDQLVENIHPGHKAAVTQALATMRERGYISQTFASADKTKWLDIRARPDSKGGELNGIVLDVTDMRAAIARTKRAEQRLKSALEGFSGPFALWDKRKRIVYWNRAFARVFGLENSIRVGMGYDTVQMAQTASVRERRNSNDAQGAELMRVSSGEWFKVVERQTNTGGMITMGLNVSADVQNEHKLTTQYKELRKLNAELERSEGHAEQLAGKLNEEKLKAEKSANSKSAFLANMSHELRTPLNAILGFSEILTNQMYGPLGDERYVGYSSDILASGQHLLDMINDILDMAKIEAGKMTVDLHPIDLVDPVDAAIRMVRRRAEDKGINLTLVPEDDLPLVDADHRAIRQMILNLVSNAIKFTDDGGDIRVSIDRKDDTVCVAVRDNGVGIPADALPRLGQPFEQVSDTRDRNYDGTGLGLALTKSFAEMHGGRLTIASQEGKGTKVSFYLPIPEPAAAKITSAA